MALSSTIFKVDLAINDADRNYYDQKSLTLARHPSETDERMMLRILIFALLASPSLDLTKGLSSDEVPDLWEKNLRDEIELWVDLGQPVEKRIRKACGRSARVLVVAYGAKAPELWWSQNQGKLQRFDKLAVWMIAGDVLEALTAMVARHMKLVALVVFYNAGHHIIRQAFAAGVGRKLISVSIK